MMDEWNRTTGCECGRLWWGARGRGARAGRGLDQTGRRKRPPPCPPPRGVACALGTWWKGLLLGELAGWRGLRMRSLPGRGGARRKGAGWSELLCWQQEARARLRGSWC